MTIDRRTLLGFTLVVATAMSGAAQAQTEQADARAFLTVSGNVTAANADGSVSFDRESLEALGMVTIDTATPWHKGVVRFEGVPLHKLMQTVGAKGEKVAVVALNDYSSEIPIEDFEKHNVILALKRDGEYMPVRDKGPLFVIYPYDEKPELRNQKFYSRSVWQVSRIIVK